MINPFAPGYKKYKRWREAMPSADNAQGFARQTATRYLCRKITQTMTTVLLEIENPQDLETLVPLLRRLQIKFSTTETTSAAKSKPNGKSHKINDLQRLLLAAPDLSDEVFLDINAKR